MAKHKLTGWVTAIVLLLTLAATVLFMSGEALGMVPGNSAPKYAQVLFSTDKVHTIDIIVDEGDWAEMIANATAEAYIECAVVIDGEAVKGVGIRPKGNSSLATIASSDSDRYSFKVEFDHYESGKTFYGLDKLALNNIAQDSTYMKDYVTYQMMVDFGAASPLSSFVWITVNGADWGLYTAVEGIEDAFAVRNYGNDFGEMYKPDTMDMNNRENIGNDAGDFAMPDAGAMPQMPEGFAMPDAGGMPEGGFQMPEGDFGGSGGFPAGDEFAGSDGSSGGSSSAPDATATQPAEAGQPTEDVQQAQAPDVGGGFGGFGGFGMGGTTNLVYADDNPDSYSAIFDNAVFDITDADKTRLIEALRKLSAGEDIENTVDVEAVMRYFIVHNFVMNGDSYTGSMVHNYYLYEKDGQLAMVPWDYNLAFGGMGGGMRGGFGGFGGSTASLDSATSMINHPIDDPLLSGSMSEKPMLAWIFNSEEYTAMYHELMAEFMTYFDSGAFAAMYDGAIALITPYVEKDPTAFCTYDEFVTAQTELREFITLRAESISLQLDGTIASTSAGQTASGYANFVDGSGVNTDVMGSMNMGFDRARSGGGWPGRERTTDAAPPAAEGTTQAPAQGEAQIPAQGFSPGTGTRTATTPSSTQNWILLGACGLVLIGGAAFALKRRA
jgi:spore coat protein CotH